MALIPKSGLPARPSDLSAFSASSHYGEVDTPVLLAIVRKFWMRRSLYSTDFGKYAGKYTRPPVGGARNFMAALFQR
jgi:hypothetical protein